MIIKVIGKAHLQGESKKTGKPYDFIQVHYNGPAYGVEGLGAITQNLSPQYYDYDSIQIGKCYDLQFDNRGYPVSFKLADDDENFSNGIPF